MRQRQPRIDPHPRAHRLRPCGRQRRARALAPRHPVALPNAVYVALTALGGAAAALGIALELFYRRLRVARRRRGDRLQPYPYDRLVAPFKRDRDPSLERLLVRIRLLLIAFNAVGAAAVVLLARYGS